MDKWIRSLIYKKFNIKNVEFTVLDFIFLLGITICGCAIRMSVKSMVTGDFEYFLDPWMTMFDEYGFAALGMDFYNYNTPYMILLYLASLTGINHLTAVKLISIVFDFLLAVTVGFVMREMSDSKTKIMFAYGAVWMFPTIVCNSAFWGQCDSIYTFFILLSVYFMLKGKSLPSMILYGIAFAFKMQAIFILPAYLILWTKKKLKLAHFLAIPIMYVLSLVPAMAAGMSFGGAVGLYGKQLGTATGYLECNWPGVYELIGIEPYWDYYGPAGMWFTVCILMCFMFYMAYKNYKVTNISIIEVFLYVGMLTVYFLPYMHERYGYVAGIFAIIFGLVNMRKIYIPIVHGIVSYTAYQACLTDVIVTPHWVWAIVLLLLLVDMGIYIFKYVQSTSTPWEEA